MSQPLYFLPNLSREQLSPGDTLLPEVLAERGLKAAFGDIRSLQRECFCANVARSPLPNAGSGTLLTYQLRNGAIPMVTAIDPNSQEWCEAMPGRLWIGYQRDAPPSPSDLARRTMTLGDCATLNGQEWTIPIVRRMDASTKLPSDIYFDSSGNLVEVIKGSYRQLWERMAVPAEWFFGDTFGQYDKRLALELCIDVLGINYRFGVHEQRALRILDSESLLGTIGMALDYYRARAIEDAKKKEESSSEPVNTTPGLADA